MSAARLLRGATSPPNSCCVKAVAQCPFPNLLGHSLGRGLLGGVHLALLGPDLQFFEPERRIELLTYALRGQPLPTHANAQRRNLACFPRSQRL